MKNGITWIRHGESSWNAEGRWQGHTDIDLSEIGMQQAVALRRRLKSAGLSFDRVYCSDLKRAKQTALLAMPETKLLEDPRLREINFGIYEGKVRDELNDAERKDVYDWWYSPYQRALPRGESMQDLRRRVDAWQNELPPNISIAVFTHGGVIRDRLWRETGAPENGRWSFQVDNTSLTVIEYSEQRNLIHCVNDRSHLESVL